MTDITFRDETCDNVIDTSNKMYLRYRNKILGKVDRVLGRSTNCTAATTATLTAVPSAVASGGTKVDHGLHTLFGAAMKEIAQTVPMKHKPTSQQAQRALEEARCLFARLLAGWASDVLALRAAGLDRPSWRSDETQPEPVRPS